MIALVQPSWDLLFQLHACISLLKKYISTKKVNIKNEWNVMKKTHFLTQTILIS